MKLHEQRDYYKALAAKREEALQEILDYVQSEKYHVDQNVNAADIILRINESKNQITREFNA